MKKNGFIFIESIVVLVIVAMSVTTLMSTYTLIARKTKEKENYDKASDKYLLYAIANLGTNDKCNYGLDCDGSIDPRLAQTEFEASASNCTQTKIGGILYNCEEVFNDMGIKYIYVIKNIRNTLNDYKTNSDGRAIDSSNNPISRSDDDKADLEKVTKIVKNPAHPEIKLAVERYDNGAIEYMKTLKKCNDSNDVDASGIIINRNKETYICDDSIMYMIGVFERGNQLYYASINISGSVKYEDYVLETKSGWICTNCGNGTPIKNQLWYYYRNNAKLQGLYELAPTNNVEATNTYYYYFDSTGVMSIGWIKGVIDGDKYYLFSPIDYAGDGSVDGRRVQATKQNYLKVTINGSKVFYVDKKGACYLDQALTNICTDSDVSGEINSLSASEWCNYLCNGTRCYPDSTNTCTAYP